MRKKRKKTVQEVEIVICHRFQGKEPELGQLRQSRKHRIDHRSENSLCLGQGFGKGSAGFLGQFG